MRPLHTLLASLIVLPSLAQWPSDPGDPLVICDDASSQKNLRILGDGAGGWFILWTDNRIDPARYAVYGQRVDDQGMLQWEPNGRLIQEVPGRSINFIGCTRLDDNHIFMAYISGADALSGDTVRAMAYDSEGAAVWSAPTLLAYPGPLPGGGTSGGNYYPRVTSVPGGAFVGWGSNPMGAADYVYLARVRNDGSNAMPEQGVEVPSLNNSIVTGPWTFRHDLAGGLMLEERWGNGAGAPLFAMRVDSMGVERWPALLQVSANSNGLGYEWSTAFSSTGQANSVWGYGYDLRMAIYDTSGTLLNSLAPIDVCLQADVQENPFVMQHDGMTTVFWADNRTSAGNGRQVFMQRFTSTGAPLLAADGILAMQVNGNSNGFPRAVLAEDTTFITSLFAPFTVGSGTPGLRAGRVSLDGTNQWSDTTRFCTPELGPNGGTDYGLVPDGDGGAAAFWFNYQNDALYAARLDRWGRMGDFTGIAEEQRSSFSLFPNPATDRVTLQSNDGRPLGDLRIHAADGRVVRTFTAPGITRLELDLRTLPGGVYTVLSSDRHGISSLRFVKQ